MGIGRRVGVVVHDSEQLQANLLSIGKGGGAYGEGKQEGRHCNEKSQKKSQKGVHGQNLTNSMPYINWQK